MNKKKYLIIAGLIAFFAIIIVVVLLSKNKKNNWIDSILDSDTYSIVIADCTNNEKKLAKEVLKEISTQWKNLSDNGPWMGDENTCYTTVTINYEKDGIIREAQLLLVDDSSFVLTIDNVKEYYTNSKNLNTYLNKNFE